MKVSLSALRRGAFFYFLGEKVMGYDDVDQFLSDEDGCIYFFDEKRNIYKKICDVSIRDLPVSVKNKIRDAKKRAEIIINLPLK
jgi:hypothetical protein